MFCVLLVMQPTWTVVLCCTPFPTLRHDCPKEKSAHAWYRMVHAHYVSSTGDLYHKVLPHSLHFCCSFFFYEKRRKKRDFFCMVWFINATFRTVVKWTRLKDMLVNWTSGRLMYDRCWISSLFCAFRREKVLLLSIARSHTRSLAP